MIPKWYKELFEQYKELLNQYSQLYIGLSAGIDSNMLLNWLYTYRNQLPPIVAIHVNHQWHGEDSFIWANFAKQRAEYYGFDFVNYDVTIDIDQKGAEACGREARYIKFAETMVDNGLLLVAHHRSDQAETVMYRLLRGSGTLGLGGMRSFTKLQFGGHTLSVLRPFLSISKKELYRAGESMDLPWMEDYTNHETEEARNQIRNGIFPSIEQYFPHYEQTFARSAELIQESDELLLEIARCDAKLVIHENTLNLTAIQTLSPLRQKNILRYWLKNYDVILEKRQFDEFISMFISKKPTSESCFSIDNWQVRAYKNLLYFMWIPESIDYTYELQPAANAPSLEFWQDMKLALIDRPNGAIFHPLWRDRSQTIKKLLQEIELAPWQRTTMKMLQEPKTEKIVWSQYLGLHRDYKDFCQVSGYLPVIIETVRE